MKFVDLFSLERNLPVVEQQDLRSRIFEQEFSSITEDKIFLWHLGKSFPQVGKRFLFGVYPNWNPYDIYLLDCINDSLRKKPIIDFFEVVNLDDLSLDKFHKIFGDIKPKQPPILGIWEDGILSKTLWGWEAKNFLTEKFEFIWQPPKIWLNQQ